MKSRGPNIALLNHIGGGNLGDDATLLAVMSNIRRRWPDANITALTMNPDDSRKRHGVVSHPIRRTTWDFGYRRPLTAPSLKSKIKRFVGRSTVLLHLFRMLNGAALRAPKQLLQELAFLGKSFRITSSFDLLIICGGGQLTEWGGPWAFPYTIFKWVLLARCSGVRVIFLNVGAGPLTHPLSKYFVSRALRVADYVSFRDVKSQELSRRIGFAGRSGVSPDSVYALEPSELGVNAPTSRNRLTVAIAPLPYCNPRTDPAEKDQRQYDDFIRKMAAFSAHLHRHSYALMLFGSDIGVDPLAIEDLQKALQERHDHTSVQAASVDSIEELLRSISKCDYVVTCRFHGVIFAHLLLKPVLALSPHPKVRDLMRDLGLERYCVDIRTCDHGLLVSMFETLVRNSDEVRQQMTRTLVARRSSLITQFDELFSGEHAGGEQAAALVDGIRRRGFLATAFRGRGEWTIGKVR